jgi:hypothetical protein
MDQGRVFAARSAHGDFADYHERFGHDTELTCQRGRRKSPIPTWTCAKRSFRLSENFVAEPLLTENLMQVPPQGGAATCPLCIYIFPRHRLQITQVIYGRHSPPVPIMHRFCCLSSSNCRGIKLAVLCGLCPLKDVKQCNKLVVPGHGPWTTIALLSYQTTSLSPLY